MFRKVLKTRWYLAFDWYVHFTLWSHPRLFKSFEFGNGSRMSDEKLVILEFKYLQNKKWQKQAVKSARIKKSYRTYWLFSLYSDNWKKLVIFLQKLAIFNIYHVFAPFMKLYGCRFLYLFSLCDIRKEAVYLLQEHCSLRGVKQKKHVKNVKFWPLNHITRDPIEKPN